MEVSRASGAGKAPVCCWPRAGERWVKDRGSDEGGLGECQFSQLEGKERYKERDFLQATVSSESHCSCLPLLPHLSSSSIDMLSPVTSPLATFLLTAVGHLVTVRAATCSDTQCVSPASWDDAWNARETFCGDSQPWSTDGCFAFSDGQNIVTLQISEPGQGTEQICWDAYEDIIDQCIEDSGVSGGTYSYNGVVYTLSMCGTC